MVKFARVSRLLRKAAVVGGAIERGGRLLRQMTELVSNGGEPFAPLPYDFDSLENRDVAAVERVLSLLAEPMEEYFESEVRGLAHAGTGPALFVGNHSGGTWSPEIFLFGAALYRARGLAGLPYGLAHSAVERIAPIGRLLIPLGAIRASHQNAARLFETGRSVLVYPGGDEECFRPSTRRDEIVFAGRRGYVRLALQHGVPIVPVVTFGAHDVFWVIDDGRWLAERVGLAKRLRIKVLPLTFSLPWGLMLGGFLPFLPFPARVSIEVLPPIHFDRRGAEAAADAAYVADCAARVEAAMQVCLSRLALEKRYGERPPVETLRRTPDNEQEKAVRAA